MNYDLYKNNKHLRKKANPGTLRMCLREFKKVPPNSLVYCVFYTAYDSGKNTEMMEVYRSEAIAKAAHAGYVKHSSTRVPIKMGIVCSEPYWNYYQDSRGENVIYYNTPLCIDVLVNNKTKSINGCTLAQCFYKEERPVRR